MTTQHTPGPWNDGLHYKGQLGIQADNGRLVALCGQLAFDDMQLENQANARLIASAPELLEALRTIAANASSVQMDPQWAVQIARNAIAKATGHE